MRFLQRSITGLFLLAVTLGILGYAGLMIYDARQERLSQEQRQRPARERIFAVDVIAFQPATITPVLQTFGEVRSRRTLELRATAGGRIVYLADSFEEGGQVTAGDLLLRVDPQDAQSAYDLAMTDQAEGEAEQRDANQALELAEAELVAAEEQLTLRTSAAQRTQDLFSRGLSTEEAVEAAVLAEASAKQSVLSRRQAVAQASARVDLAVTTLARRAIALADAKRRLDETELHAEFTGTLSDVTVVKGGLVQNTERLAELVDPSAMEVSFRVSNAEYARLLDDQGALIGSQVTVTLKVLGADLTTPGTISRESAAVGEGQTGRVLFAQLEAPKGLRPGDFVEVSVEEPDLNFAMQLPATAVDAANTVLVLGEEDRLEIAEVSILRRQGDDVIVRGRGLRDREVVAARTPLLGEGIKIRPLRADDSTAPEAPAMVALTDERRAKLIAFVEGNNRMPAEAKERVLNRLQEPEVPAQMVERIESRMGG